MTRRNALKLIGAMVAVARGTPVSAKDYVDDLRFVDFDEPGDYFFKESQIRNIVIETKTGPDIVVPFSEIVKALRG